MDIIKGGVNYIEMYEKRPVDMYDLEIIKTGFRSFDLGVSRRLLSETEYRVGILLSLVIRESTPYIVLAFGKS